MERTSRRRKRVGAASSYLAATSAAGLNAAARLAADGGAAVAAMEQATDLLKNAAAGSTANRLAAIAHATTARLNHSAGRLSGTASGLAARDFAAAVVTVELRTQTLENPRAASARIAAIGFAATARLSNTAGGLAAATATQQPEGSGVLGAEDHQGGTGTQHRQSNTTLHSNTLL